MGNYTISQNKSDFLHQLAVAYKAFDLTIFAGPKLRHSPGLSNKEIAVGGKI
jgi:hypothetical protein